MVTRPFASRQGLAAGSFVLDSPCVHPHLPHAPDAVAPWGRLESRSYRGLSTPRPIAFLRPTASRSPLSTNSVSWPTTARGWPARRPPPLRPCCCWRFRHSSLDYAPAFSAQDCLTEDRAMRASLSRVPTFMVSIAVGATVLFSTRAALQLGCARADTSPTRQRVNGSRISARTHSLARRAGIGFWPSGAQPNWEVL